MANGNSKYEYPFVSFVNPFLEAAGKVYISAEEIKARKKEQKRMQDKLDFDIKKAKADEEQRIAEMLFNQILKERAAKAEAERPPKETIQRIVYGMPGEETGTRKVEVSGMPSGGGAGGVTESQLLTRLAALNDDKQNLVNKITPLARYDNTYKIVAGSVSKINSAIETGDYNTALSIYNAAKSEIDAIPINERGPNYNTALNDLENYLGVARQVIYINSQIYKTPAVKTPGITPKAKGDANTEVLSVWNDVNIPMNEKWQKLADIATQYNLTIEQLKAIVGSQ